MKEKGRRTLLNHWQLSMHKVPPSRNCLRLSNQEVITQASFFLPSLELAHICRVSSKERLQSLVTTVCDSHCRCECARTSIHSRERQTEEKKFIDIGTKRKTMTTIESLRIIVTDPISIRTDLSESLNFSYSRPLPKFPEREMDGE